MDDDWETLAEQEDIAPKIKADVNKWDGEDIDEDVKESWEDEDEDEDEKKDEEKIEPQPTPSKSKPKKPNPTKEKERKQIELDEKLEEERLAKMTLEEKMSEKLRLQQIEKESDLKNALDTFGVVEPLTGLDAMHPTNKVEFTEFAEALSTKITLYKADELYPNFVEELVRNICASLGASELRKIKITVDNLHLEKQKMEKEKNKKPAAKGKTKIKLRVESDNVMTNNVEDYGEGGYDDYDDFM